MKAKIKNRYWLNILTLFTTAVFILSLFSGIAAAETPKDKYQDAKKSYQDAKERYQDAKVKYNEAKLKYKSAKNNLSRDELKDKTRNYLEDAADYMISHLELLKNNVESSENKGVLPTGAAANIDAHIVQLTDIKTKIQAANTTKELTDSARELEDAWIKIDLEARYYAGIIVNHRIDLFVIKASNASERMDTLIQKLKDQGKDTSKLEEEASGFNNLMNEAKQNHQNDLTLFASHNGFDSSGKVTSIQDAKTFLQQATSSQKDTLKKLKSATEQSRDFFKEAKKLIGGNVVVARGTGRLEANGTGKALIKGNVTVTLSGNATLIVSSNADVTTDGTGTKETLGSGDIKYQGFGSATITGENIRIEISGNEITLTAEGTGSAILTGRGTYRVEKEFTASGEWKKEE
ncbi:MAG: hypothetical protein OIN66_02705 [Candidatus Methanoperedens sp.]|nr:hypothetical protein [Candidatus Methanoperedens sp.]